MTQLPTRTAFGQTHQLKSVNIGRCMPECIRGVLPISWAGTFVFTSGTWNTPQIKTLSLNNLYDPMLSLGTAQPLAFDKLGPLYRAYYVYGATVEIVVTNDGQISTEVGWIATSTETFAAAESFDGLPFSDSTVVTANADKKVWKFYLDNYRVAGLRNSRLHQNNPFTASTTTGGPTIPVYLQLKAAPLADTGNQDIHYMVKIDYHYCMFDNQNTEFIDA